MRERIKKNYRKIEITAHVLRLLYEVQLCSHRYFSKPCLAKKHNPTHVSPSFSCDKEVTALLIHRIECLQLAWVKTNR